MIKKIVVGVVLLSAVLFAKVTNVPATMEFVEDTKMKIIDIRTKGEWVQMGIIKKAHLITFFDERYGYDAKAFLEELDRVVKKDEEFAIICNSGSRTKLIANFLGVKNSYNVVNLTGGMMNLLREGFIPAHYNPNAQKTPVELSKPSQEMLDKEASLKSSILDSNSSQ
jgi:rhodanese-related sulfurtransferase